VKGEAAHFNFGKWMTEPESASDKISPKGMWSCDPFSNFGAIISLELVDYRHFKFGRPI